MCVIKGWKNPPLQVDRGCAISLILRLIPLPHLISKQIRIDFTQIQIGQTILSPTPIDQRPPPPPKPNKFGPPPPKFKSAQPYPAQRRSPIAATSGSDSKTSPHS